MLSSEKFDALVASLRQSLKHSQYEHLGMPFNKDARYAFGANWYGTLTEFNLEFKTWLYNADKDRLNEYIKDVYYKISFFGVLFAKLSDNYQRQLVCSDGRLEFDCTRFDELNLSEPYQRVDSYACAIASQANEMRELASKFAKVELTMFQKLTIDSFTIDGKYINKPSLNNPIPQLAKEQQPGFDIYIKEEYRKQLMPFLTNKYRNKKAKMIVPMLYALESLGIVSGKVMDHSQTDLHNALTVTFGDIGVRTSLNDSLHKYWLNPQRPDLDRKQQIEMHKTPIANLLKNEEPE